jgi:mannose-1-phosphate guanylyltransferase
MIMAGGGGTRFWPRSRARRPKQFLAFSGDRSLLQGTYDRIEALVPAERTWVITGAAHQQEAAAQLTGVPRGRIVGEPMGRDTAMCIALGAALVARQEPEAVMAVMPADHVIEPAREFGRALQAAEQLALDHPAALITFGIPPTFASTNYGYILRGEAVTPRNGIPAFRVLQFREKPSQKAAEGYLASGEYFWNSGIFVWKVSAILAELQNHKPKLLAAAQRIADAWGSPRQDDVFRQEYDSAEKISIDFAVMEHAREVLVVQAPYVWDDVGSWLALERHNPQDPAGNTVQALHVGHDTTRCVVVSEPGRVVATIGVEDLIIIQDGDATLIAHRSREAEVKKIVDRLKSARDLEKFL